MMNFEPLFWLLFDPLEGEVMLLTNLDHPYIRKLVYNFEHYRLHVFGFWEEYFFKTFHLLCILSLFSLMSPLWTIWTIKLESKDLNHIKLCTKFGWKSFSASELRSRKCKNTYMHKRNEIHTPDNRWSEKLRWAINFIDQLTLSFKIMWTNN